jgi:hypothetical protein
MASELEVELLIGNCRPDVAGPVPRRLWSQVQGATLRALTPMLDTVSPVDVGRYWRHGGDIGDMRAELTAQESHDI